MAGNASEIRRGVYLKVRDEFNFNNVIGLSSLPPITQRATHKLEDPFIYIWSESQLEVNKTKEDESYQYAVRIEVSTKANSNQGGQQQSDQMAAEIYRIFDVPTSQYPDITDKGYRIYIIEFAETASFVEEVRGGTYFRKVITILVTAKFVGFDGTDIPVQLTNYNYNNWMYTPTVFDLERYDSGTIIPVTTYPSTGSWNFVDSSFTIGAGAGGTFTNDIYTLGSEDAPVALSSTLNYTRPSNAGRIATNVLPEGAGSIYNNGNTPGSWYFANEAGVALNIPDGTEWASAGIELDAIVGNFSMTTIVAGDTLRLTLPNGSYIEWIATSRDIRSTNVGLLYIDAIAFSFGTVNGCSAAGLATQIQLDTITGSEIDNYALMATTEWSRIGSLRYGVIESASQPVFTDDTSTGTGLRDLANFQSSDDTIAFGTVNPIGETITFNGVEGQWMYIIIDKSQANLTGLIDSFNEDNLNFFENPVVVGEYKVYVQKRALSYTNTLTFTIQ